MIPSTRRTILLALSCISLSVRGADSSRSARRDPAESWTQASGRVSDPVRVLGSSDPSAFELARAIGELDDSEVASWPLGGADAQKIFEEERDRRFLNPTSFPRRISWLYPDDGCWVRAALFDQRAELRKLPRPSKIFVFGDLVAPTRNSPYGKVSWWYHVAPIVKIEGQVKVLDPSLEARTPLSVVEWTALFSSRPQELKATICDGYSYGPSDACRGGRAHPSDRTALSEIGGYLLSEWSRLLALHRDPEVELGERPPWASGSAPSP